MFDAPRDLLWTCFTDPERMKHWWGPKGFTVIASKMDLRVGGTYHYGMKTPDGKTMWGKFVYREIIPPERLVFVNSFSDESRRLTRHPMAPTWPLQMLSTFTFEERPAARPSSPCAGSQSTPPRRSSKTFDAGHASMQGWGGTMDQLEAYLARRKDRQHGTVKTAPYGERTVTLTRVFDAPRELVWRAWTDPKHMAQWFGPNGFTSSVPELNVAPAAPCASSCTGRTATTIR